MPPRPTSNQELDCLLHLAQQGPLTAASLWEGFGAPRNLARTTVLTILERLRRKGHVARRKQDGIYVYRALEGHVETMRRSVGQFVDRALGGSISPFAAYLSERTSVSDEELAELNRAVRALTERKRRTS
ncbi:MAG TPA: BlaI/MecI/CopY family transcriptional regulator [Candidatus Eisenbacteria bacterium]|nr:BlaI/MecI/CopY family transcriptional regulator [Candidatus Eisenbacteria bacterium]